MDFGSFLDISPVSVLSEISACIEIETRRGEGIGYKRSDKGEESAGVARNIVDNIIVRVTEGILPDQDRLESCKPETHENEGEESKDTTTDNHHSLSVLVLSLDHGLSDLHREHVSYFIHLSLFLEKYF